MRALHRTYDARLEILMVGSVASTFKSVHLSPVHNSKLRTYLFLCNRYCTCTSVSRQILGELPTYRGEFAASITNPSPLYSLSER